MTVVLWDNNIYNNTVSPTEVFGHFNRDALEWENDDLMTTYITTSNTEFDKIDRDKIFTISPQRTYKKKV